MCMRTIPEMLFCCLLLPNISRRLPFRFPYSPPFSHTSPNGCFICKIMLLSVIAEYDGDFLGGRRRRAQVSDEVRYCQCAHAPPSAFVERAKRVCQPFCSRMARVPHLHYTCRRPHCGKCSIASWREIGVSPESSIPVRWGTYLFGFYCLVRALSLSLPLSVSLCPFLGHTQILHLFLPVSLLLCQLLAVCRA